MRLTSTECGILFKKSFLNVEAKRARLVVFEAFLRLLQRVLVNRAVGIKNVIKRLTSILRLLGEQFLRPNIF